jgi:AraC-like DNA-binding protein
MPGREQDPRLTEIERVVHAGERVRIGAFRCPVDHPLFADSGPIQNDIFVFPRTRVRIRHEGGSAFAGDTHTVALYNRGQRYRREALDARGDECDWFAVARELVLDVAVALDPSAADRPERPFAFSHGPSDARTYLLQRRLFARLDSGEWVEPLEVEETTLRLLGRVLAQARSAWQGRSRPPTPPGHGERDLAEHAGRILAARFRDPITLSEVAGMLRVSHVHLCRAFRRATGTTLHAYREQLRLRAALEALEAPRAELTELALDLGYSSHSHFTAAFRRAFGVTPSQVRGRRRSAMPERPPRRGDVRAWSRARSAP